MLSTAAQQKIFARLLSKPESLKCADCGSKSPSWASIDFGVFVCLNCSGAHRALGPSVTRVRSTKLDSWQSEWAELMELGNEKCNAYWQANIGISSKPTASSPLEEIKRFVVDKYVKRKFAKTGDSDPVTNLKTFRAIEKAPVSEPHSAGFTKVKDQDRFKTTGGVKFQNFDPFKKVPEQVKEKKKEPVDIFDFDERPSHESVHINPVMAGFTNLHPQPEIKRGHSLDFTNTSHNNLSALNLTFSTPSQGPCTPSLPPVQQTHPNLNNCFNQFHSIFPSSSPQQPQQQFNQQAQSFGNFQFGSLINQHSSSVPHAFEVFGKQHRSNQPQQQSHNPSPISMSINMYANNINFNFSSESKVEEKKDPFSTLDEFSF